MKVYNQGILVAETRPEKNIYDLPYLWLIEGTPEELVPWSLFGVGPFRVNKVRMDKVLRGWLASRVFPEERIGADSELRKLGLKRYDVIDITIATAGKHLGDRITIDMENLKVKGAV